MFRTAASSTGISHRGNDYYGNEEKEEISLPTQGPLYNSIDYEYVWAQSRYCQTSTHLLVEHYGIKPKNETEETYESEWYFVVELATAETAGPLRVLEFTENQGLSDVEDIAWEKAVTPNTAIYYTGMVLFAIPKAIAYAVHYWWITLSVIFLFMLYLRRKTIRHMKAVDEIEGENCEVESE